MVSEGKIRCEINRCLRLREVQITYSSCTLNICFQLAIEGIIGVVETTGPRKLYEIKPVMNMHCEE